MPSKRCEDAISGCEDATFKCEGALYPWVSKFGKKSKIISGRPCNCLYVTKTVLKGCWHGRFDWEWKNWQKQWWHWAGETVPIDRPAIQHPFTCTTGSSLHPDTFHSGTRFSESALATASTLHSTVCDEVTRHQVSGCKTSLTLVALLLRQ